MELNGKRYKVHNMIFMDAGHSLSLLGYYYQEVLRLLNTRGNEFRDYVDELESSYQEKDRQFDKEFWLKHYDVYNDYYPNIFRNSFIISTCSLFEEKVGEILEFIQEEHKVPFHWEVLKDSVLGKIKRYLKFAGINISDDKPEIQLQPPGF